MKRYLHLLCVLAAIIQLALTGCSENDPQPTDGAMQTDAQLSDASQCTPNWQLSEIATDSQCGKESSDFTPGDANDSWPACISDGDPNVYSRFDMNISTIGRVAGFEEIASLLFIDGIPNGAAFASAREAYIGDGQGLESRISRREDEHFPAAPQACRDLEDNKEYTNYPDRCVGQAKIRPLLSGEDGKGFADGERGTDPLINAARVEAALLWFLYVSVHKEATTCTGKKADCDSSYAYYSGGDDRSGGKGLARYIKTVSQAAHDRIWDGILAVRCWRDLDNADTATDLALRDRAIAQLDRALLYGVSAIVRSRTKSLANNCGTAKDALWLTIQILGGVLNREATARNADLANTLRSELAKPVTEADTNAIDTTLATLFPCP